MDILYLLIPLSVMLVLLIIAYPAMLWVPYLLGIG